MSRKKIDNIERIETVLSAAYAADYREIPVSMKRFLQDENFLGKVTGGGKTIYPLWKEVLSDISIDDAKYLIILTGAIGIGKTSTAVEGIAYGMHRILCLKDPWKFYAQTGGGKMEIVFFNLTKSLSASRGYNLLQSYLMSSLWFKSRGIVVGTETNPRIEFPVFEYVLASPYAKGFGTIGGSTIFALMDEVDSETESEKQKIRVLQAYESTVARFDSRFVRVSSQSRQRETLGRFFLCASKQEQLSFLNTFIVKMKNSPTVRIVDAALWEVKTDLNLSGKRFSIMLGDPYTPSKILGIETENGFEVDNKGIEDAEKMGFKVIQVPIEYLERFQKDPIGSLRRLAGISVDQLRRSKLFPSEKLIVDCYDPAKRDPVKMLTIEVGLDDDINLAEFIDFSAIRIPRSYPRYMHVDIAYSGNGDALGLGMSCISGWVDRSVEDLESGGVIKVEKVPVVETDFGMRIHARPGDKIPLSKVRKLIVDLKKVYSFNIRLVTFDLDLLSEDSKQILTAVGINCDSLSLDKNPQIYRNFARNIVADKRWCCHRNEWLHFELANLEDDHEKNRVDHPDEVMDVEILGDGSTRDIVVKGSKDVSDGVVGSIENALRGAEIPMGKEFTKVVTGVLSRPAQRGTPGSLLSIPRGAIVKGGGKEGEPNEDKIPKKFKEIFKRSQGRR